MGTIYFRTVEQAILWENEICGQLSDGKWENTRPYNHWKPWCNAKVEISVRAGRDFWAQKTSYRLDDPLLLEIVGERMKAYVKLGRAFGRENVKDTHYFVDLDGKFRGLPDFKGEHYDKIRERLSALDLEKVKAVLDADSYTDRDLRDDLHEMKMAMKTFRKEDLLTGQALQDALCKTS